MVFSPQSVNPPWSYGRVLVAHGWLDLGARVGALVASQVSRSSAQAFALLESWPRGGWLRLGGVRWGEGAARGCL